MADLLLVFLGAALLEHALLWRFLDGGAHAAVGRWLPVPISLLILAAMLRLFSTSIPAIPAPAMAYLHSLALVTTAMAVAARPGASALAQDRRLNWLRTWLPLLAANLAVLVFVLLDGRHGNLRAGAGFCLGASLAFYLTMLFVTSLRERVERAAVSRRWQGLPTLALTACLVALALSGYRGLMPW